MKIIIAGDLCPRHRSVELIEEKRFEEIFSEVKPILESADYSIVNFECPVVENPLAKPIPKCGPNLRCTKNAVEAIRFAGFNGVTLANNHVLDFGEEGLHDTVTACKNVGLDMVGVGDNLKDAATVLYKTICGKRVAFINCCENEFSVATDITSGANPVNPVQQFYSIQQARKKADFVILIVHGGPEHFQLPSPRMKELYRYFVDCGADVVVNHHQHCFSGYEVYKDKPIIYGLGNFYFDEPSKRNCMWNEAYFVELIITSSGIGFNLFPFFQCNSDPKITLLNSTEEHQFNAKIKELNEIISNDGILNKRYSEWADENASVYHYIFELWNNRITRGLFVRGLLPSLFKRLNKAALLNFVYCESHRDRLVSMLIKKNNES